VRLRAVVAVSGLPGGYHVVAPAHPCASPLRGISTARVARPPPKGSLKPALHFTPVCY